MTQAQIADLTTFADAAIVAASFALAQLLYVAVSDVQLSLDVNYSVVGLIAGLIHYVVVRAYQGASKPRGPDSLMLSLKQIMITFAAVIAIGYGLKQAELHSRLWLGLAFVISFASIAATRRLLAALTENARFHDLLVERIALFGDRTNTQQLEKSLQAELDSNCRISVYDSESLEHTASAGDLAEIARLVADGLNGEFDRIVFCLPSEQLGRLKELVDAVNFLPTRIEVCLAQAELQVLKSSLVVSPRQILVNVDDLPQNDWGVLFKRVIDVALGCIVLALAAPVMVLAAIAIKLESKGPVFFRQRRHGWNHSVISVWKFRTMSVQEDGDNVRQAVANDPRVTRVGRFLRRSSIDELPQLFNVLNGEMSLVGPRPHALAHNVQYSELIESYALRHRVKPGMTGWAQVRGLRGNSADISKMIARAEADIWYIRNWSIGLDLKIILMTASAIVLDKNAV